MMQKIKVKHLFDSILWQKWQMENQCRQNSGGVEWRENEIDSKEAEKSKKMGKTPQT